MKKLIRKYLRKKLYGINIPKHYVFLRWLADIVKDEIITNEICHQLAYWLDYHPDFKGMLNDLFIIDNQVYIYTITPSIWIGKAGSVLENITHFLNYEDDGQKVADFQVNLIQVADTAPFSQVYHYLAHIKSHRIANDFGKNV
jgi:hypothetical protein